MAGPSSHDPEDLARILGGRVEVARHPGGMHWRFRVAARTADGRVHTCVLDEGRTAGRHIESEWTVAPSVAGHRAILRPPSKPTGSRVRYDAETGRLAVGASNLGIAWIGHLQDSVPAAVYRTCPGFPAPSALGLPLNGRQTAKGYDELLAQDPGAVLKGL